MAVHTKQTATRTNFGFSLFGECVNRMVMMMITTWLLCFRKKENYCHSNITLQASHQHKEKMKIMTYSRLRVLAKIFRSLVRGL